jgi:hypothetical protein
MFTSNTVLLKGIKGINESIEDTFFDSEDTEKKEIPEKNKNPGENSKLMNVRPNSYTTPITSPKPSKKKSTTNPETSKQQPHDTQAEIDELKKKYSSLKKLARALHKEAKIKDETIKNYRESLMDYQESAIVDHSKIRAVENQKLLHKKEMHSITQELDNLQEEQKALNVKMEELFLTITANEDVISERNDEIMLQNMEIRLRDLEITKLKQDALERDAKIAELERQALSRDMFNKLSGLSRLMESTCNLTPKDTNKYISMNRLKNQFTTLLITAMNENSNNDTFAIASELQSIFDSFLQESLRIRHEWHFWAPATSGSDIISKLNTDEIKMLLNLLPRKNIYHNTNGIAIYAEVKQNLDVSSSIETYDVERPENIMPEDEKQYRAII